MKKKIIAIVVIVVLVITALLIPTETYQKWFGKTPVEEIPEGETYDYHQIVYLKNKDGLLAGVKVPVPEIAQDQILQKWELLTKKVSQIPSGYTSVVNSATELIEHRIEGSTLILNVSEDFLQSEGRATIEAIAWTFIDEAIREVVILVNGEQINSLNDYHFQKIVKENGINHHYETLFLYEATPTTIIEDTEEYILPVTYFHLNDDICDFILGKTVFVDGFNSSEEQYNYVITNDAMIINLLSTDSLSEYTLESIADSVKENFTIGRLTINGSETVLHEAVFQTEDS